MKQARMSGLSLMEFLVAAALASLLMTGLIKLYIGMKQNYHLQSGLATIQENGRFAMYFLDRRVHRAGDMSCVKEKPKSFQMIRGYSRANAPSRLKRQMIKNSDAFIMSSCERYKGRKQFIKTAYFISKTSYKNQQGKRVLAIYMKNMSRRSSRREELVPGIVGMHIKYGVLNKKGNSVECYVAAGQVKKWKRVTSVDISLLLSSIDNALRKPMMYRYQGKKIKAKDRNIYKEWDEYIALWNRKYE